MSIFPEDKHLEVYIHPNKGPERGPSPATIIFQSLIISIPISITLSLTLFEEIFNVDADFTAIFDRGANSGTDGLPINPDLGFSSSPNSGSTYSWEDTDYAAPSMQDRVYGLPFEPYQIVIPPVCNGTSMAGASFRIQPSTVPTMIQGIVPAGQTVFLTGQSTYGDGIIWFQAVNESILAPSDNPDAENQTAINQLGWIQDCFVSSWA
ncbi:hypothetical protein IQ254_17745 [Nodosilinea sp. LEGE 07088]|uniref:hypothetical protein n=1 Tax=Nodosilinea sp. LEGE 07088 TaxID=2777968 RepID=UPI00188029D7|nr:hypothetical protein [Nodosilinea sp. LEGE 07088]MBE9139013.1 hypothetical protein [Nodosilinea sp. LEGE 07088]